MASKGSCSGGVEQRCAIYTRKSTAAGLEQEFNSLETQREVCGAYIKCQAHRNWIELSRHYDDGGFSGGSLERPALRKLLDDIEAGRVDIVVVYKIDRLSRPGARRVCGDGTEQQAFVQQRGCRNRIGCSKRERGGKGRLAAAPESKARGSRYIDKRDNHCL